MPIKVACPGCQKKYNLKDSLAGKKIRCPACKGVVVVPSGSTASAAEKPAARKKLPAQPQQKKNTTSPPQLNLGDDVDPGGQTLGMMDAVPGIVRATQGKGEAKATKCPSCGKSIPPKEVTCPACNYNIKLRRKIGLGKAITAAQGSPGKAARIRREAAAGRVEQGRKIQIGMGAAVIGFIVFVVGAFFLMKHLAEMGDKTLAQLATSLQEPEKKFPVLGTSAKTFHGFYTGKFVRDITIPLDHIDLRELPDYQPAGSIIETGSRFARAGFLPCALSHRRTKSNKPLYILTGQAARRVLDTVEKLDGTYSPAAIHAGMKPAGGKLIIWRVGGVDLKQKESLYGALLDFGAEQAEKLAAITAHLADEDQKGGSLVISGRLHFIPSRRMYLPGGAGSYGKAIREGFDRVSNPAAVVDSNTPMPEAREQYFFHPVIVVNNAEFKPPPEREE